MADDKPVSTAGPIDLAAVASTGLLTTKEGTQADKTSISTYKLTPKYADPYTKGNDNRMARFFITKAMVQDINDAFGASADNTNSGTSDSKPAGKFDSDTVIKKLTTIGYFDFFLQSVDEAFDDRFQIVETLGDSYAVFGIGKRPRIFNFSGVLVNSVENDWRLSFIYMFQQFIGISNLAKFKTKPNVVTLRYDTMVCQGAVLNLRTSLRADNELAAPFSFSMLVTKFSFARLENLKNNPESITSIPSKPEAKDMEYVGELDALVAINQSAFDAKTKKGA